MRDGCVVGVELTVGCAVAVADRVGNLVRVGGALVGGAEGEAVTGTAEGERDTLDSSAASGGSS